MNKNGGFLATWYLSGVLDLYTYILVCIFYENTKKLVCIFLQIKYKKLNGILTNKYLTNTKD